MIMGLTNKHKNKEYEDMFKHELLGEYGPIKCDNCKETDIEIYDSKSMMDIWELERIENRKYRYLCKNCVRKFGEIKIVDDKWEIK